MWFYRHRKTPDVTSTPIDWESLTDKEREQIERQQELLDSGGLELVEYKTKSGLVIQVPTNLLDAWEEMPEEARDVVIKDMEAAIRQRIAEEEG